MWSLVDGVDMEVKGWLSVARRGGARAEVRLALVGFIVSKLGA